MRARCLTDPMSPDEAEFVQRVINDPKMARVWSELGRRRRNGAREALYPPGAAVLLMNVILDLRKLRVNVIPEREAEAARRYYLDMSAVLRRDAARIAAGRRALSHADDESMFSGNSECLIEAATFYETLAGEVSKGSMFRVGRDTGDGEARAFAMALCKIFRDGFGMPAAYGTIATIATVVLRRPVSKSRVTDWCTVGE
jgi:hypothetical protein